MKTYQRQNNTYQIFKVDSDTMRVHFLWGKFDFQIHFQKASSPSASYQDAQNNPYDVASLEHLIHSDWYTFKRVSEHGFTFEETQWEKDGQTRFFEFPCDLKAIASDIAAEELQLKRVDAA